MKCECQGCNECLTSMSSARPCRRDAAGLCSPCGGGAAYASGQAVGRLLVVAAIVGLGALGIWLHVLFIRWAVS